MSDNKFTFRKVNKDDLNLLFEWVNDPLVRSNSFNTDTIAFEDHKRWFENTLLNEDRIIFILLDEDIPVGQIRFDIEGDKAYIDYSVSKDMRGKGYGKVLLDMGVSNLKEIRPEIKTVIGLVKPENADSRNCFINSGYTEKSVCYELNLGD